MVAILAVCLNVSLPPADAAAATLPAGFSESIAFSGLTLPTAVRFSADGRVFVAEKSGLVKVFDGLGDSTATVFADLRTNVYNGWDRGLLGLALDPAFPTNPWVYVLYTYDHILGDPAPPPRWGTPNGNSDGCPNPPGANTNGCVVSGRLSRLTAAGNAMTGPEQVLIEGWCQQFPGHSVGALQFGQDGALYVSAGDGASYDWVDYGQAGSPRNPCGDPPGDVGSTLTPPTAEGGALRTQDLRTSGDPVALNGAILRVDPATGAALSTNPNFSSPDANARRIIAYGGRNPYRFAVRPGTNEIWTADVGWTQWEEINRIPDPTDAIVENFGWPCYEGMNRQGGYDGANLNICENLYAQPSADTKPYFTYAHGARVTAGEACPTGSSALSGATFGSPSGSSPYPGSYDNAFFFADYSRGCIWVMKADASGLPVPGLVEPFVVGAATPVDLERGPGGQLYYVDIGGGTIRRIDYAGTNQAPVLVSPPSVSGQAQVGATVSRVAGSWSGTQPISLTYQWQQCDAAAGCADIPGSTGTSYVVSPSDLGKTLRVRETAANTAGSNSTDSAQTSVVTQGSGSGYRSAVLADTPFLYWGLGEASGPFADSSGRGNAGSTAGTGLSRGVPGLAGSTSDGALTFTDGVSTVSRAPVAGLPSATVTAEAWFKVNAFANWSDLISHNWGGTGGHGWSMYTDASRVLTWGLWQSGGAQLNVTFPGLTAGSVYHAVGTYDGNVLRLYLNGVQVATRTVGARILNTSASVYSGRTDTAAGVTVDELALYPASLSAERVQAHYVAGTTGGGPNQAPTATITAPLSSLTWRVGDSIAFTGSGTDPEDADLPASAFEWTLLQQHCPSNCHSHTIQTFDGVKSGSFAAPDHEYPSHLELRLTVRDAQGETGTTSVALHPRTVNLTLGSSPPGLALSLNAETATAPFTRAVIEGSNNSVSASDQSLGGTSYSFQSWSDGGAATHNLVAAATTTLTAAYSGGGGNQAPTATITAPQSTLTWRVGDAIAFSGTGTDPEEADLPASAFTWTLLQQCPSSCDSDPIQTFDGVKSGSFVAPDHEYPSHLELTLTVRDAQGETDTTSVAVHPRTVNLTLGSSPPGLALTLNAETVAAPFTRAVIEGSTNSVTANDQSLGGTSYTFQSWSDGGAATHTLVAAATTTLTAAFSGGGGTPTYRSAVLADSPRLLWGLGEASGAFTDATSNGNAGTASGTGLVRGAAGLVTSTSDGALTFTNGTSNVSRPAVSGLSPTVVSVEVWFRASAFANWSDLASHNWGGSNGSGWALYLSANRQLTWGLWQSGSPEKNVKVAALTANRVYHAVGTYDGNIIRLYLDGALVASKTVGAVALNTTASVFTGRTDTTSPLTVDELAVYAGSLAPARVTAHYNAGR